MRKIITGAVVVVALAVFGFYLLNSYIYKQKQADNGEDCPQVLTDARDPETGEIHTFPTPCDIPEGWDRLETDREEFSRNGETWSRYRNADLGVRFEYRLEPDGYALVQQDIEELPSDEVVESVSLFNSEEYQELLASDIPREGPPSISLIVFENPDNLSLKQWAEESLVSAFSQAIGEIQELEFSGVPAIRYTYDGLYMTEVTIAHNSGRIYLFSGSYLDEDSAIREDFLEMLEYISLY